MPSPQSNGPDMRRWHRYPLHVPVRLVVHRAAHVAGIKMQPGEQVTVEFTPPATHDHVRLWAAVRNRHGQRYGLEFLAENNGERTQVERYRNNLQNATKPN